MQELKSQIDQSVNFVEEQLKGFIEARYVRRKPEYFNCYLSSQSGCNKGCRFCHLTATKQTTFDDVDANGFLAQAEEVFGHYIKETQFSSGLGAPLPPAKIVHYSFMARGEALANKNLLRDADSILWQLGQFATRHNLTPKFNISTIIPKTLDKPLSDVFKIITPTIYYSLYSVDEQFRKEWMPMAMPVKEAAAMLREYQKVSKKIVKIHFPFIKGQNDSQKNVLAIMDVLAEAGLVWEFNLVRYNPFSPEQGEEADQATIDNLMYVLRSGCVPLSKIVGTKEIARVGFDVKASCGMFIDKENKDA